MFHVDFTRGHGQNADREGISTVVLFDRKFATDKTTIHQRLAFHQPNYDNFIRQNMANICQDRH
jgi:hypothetical protein